LLEYPFISKIVIVKGLLLAINSMLALALRYNNMANMDSPLKRFAEFSLNNSNKQLSTINYMQSYNSPSSKCAVLSAINNSGDN
jgi:hypothetical protein